jgi:hypothetical protein
MLNMKNMHDWKGHLITKTVKQKFLTTDQGSIAGEDWEFFSSPPCPDHP